MPTYDYKCSGCGHSFERILKIADIDKPLSEPCSECGELLNERQVSAPAFGDPVRLGFIRPNGDIKEVLQKIQSKAPKATLTDSSTLTRI